MIDFQQIHGDCTRRTRESFERGVEVALQTDHNFQGIRGRCTIQSKYWHPADNLAADIHHDILEGVIPCVLKPVLQVRKLYVALCVLRHD